MKSGVARPIKVVFAIPELDSAGPERVFFELLTGLDRSRVEPAVVLLSAGGRYFDRLPKHMTVEVIGGGRHPVWRFARAVDRLRPNLVFTTLRMNIVAAAARLVQWHRPPLIARQANAFAANFGELRQKTLLKHRLAERLVPRLLRLPDVLVAQSREMADELAGFSDGRQAVVAIGNPVAIDEIESVYRQQCAGEPATGWGKPAIVAVGRLAAQKGFDNLLPAFAALLGEHADAGLTIWGEGPDRAALEVQIRSLGLADKVRLPGQTEAVLKEIAGADLLVSSSRYEGFSNAILEAMALGTPVAATDCPGATRELVFEGKTGALAAEVTSQAIHEAMRRALGFDRQAVTDAARSHVATTFDKAHIVDQYMTLFERVAVTD